MEAEAAVDAQRLLRDRRLAAERELNTIGAPLMIGAAVFMWATSRAALQPPAWVSKAWETGEQHARASFYHFFNALACAHAVAMMLFLCLHLLKAAPADRALTAVRVAMHVTLVSMAVAVAVGISEDWRGAVAAFSCMAACAAVTVLYVLGKLMKE